MKYQLLPFAAGASLLCSSFASASLTYNAAQTFLHVDGSAQAGPNDPNSFNLDESGIDNHFQRGIVESSYQFPGFPSPATARASGSAFYQAVSDLFTGVCFGATISNDPIGGSAESILNVRVHSNFTVSENTGYSLSAIGAGIVRLDSVLPGGIHLTVIDQKFVTGILPPGEYTLDAQISLASVDFTPLAAGGFQFLIPAPGASALALCAASLACIRRRQ